MMDWDAAFEEQAQITRADYKPHPVAKKKPVTSFNFTYGDFGYVADGEYADWDGVSDEEPTEEDVEAAQTFWREEGWSRALQEAAEDIGDQKYEASRGE
jgi:hypothetical protein